MLTLNSESWFVRNYLQYSSYDLPNTICQLGRRIAWMSFIWLLLFTVVTMLTSLYLIATAGFLVAPFTDATLAEIFRLHEPMQNQVSWMKTAFVTFLIMNSSMLVTAIIFVMTWLNDFIKDKIREKELKKYAETGSYMPVDLPVLGFVKGIWSRIHDKTCTLITWTNTTQDRYNKSRELAD